MCKFLGFVTTYKDGELKVYAADLVHHTACEQVHGLKPNSYDSWEWTAEGDKHLQLKEGASDTAQTEVVRQEILRLWPTRESLIVYFLRQKIVDGVWQGDFWLPSDIGAAAARYIAANTTKIEGSVDLRGYAHALPLLAHIGRSADLQGYAHALPLLAHIGWSAYLWGYAHALPECCVVQGRIYKQPGRPGDYRRRP